MLNNLKEKLLNEDYDYVINMLNMYQETDNDQLYSRSCFRIFCTEIKHSEYYISKIIKHAGKINRNLLVQYFKKYLCNNM